MDLSARKKINKTILIVFIVIVLNACHGSEKERRHTIAILEGHQPFSAATEGFQEKMTKLGYGDKNKIDYRIYKAASGSDAESDALAELSLDPPALVFAYSTGTAMAAKAALSSVPVVFAMAMVEGSGLVASKSRPEGLVTGVQVPGPEILVKRLEYLLSIKPSLKTLYTIYNASYSAASAGLDQLRPACVEVGIELYAQAVDSVEMIASHLAGAGPSPRPDAIVLLPDDFSSAEGWPYIIDYARRSAIPVCGSSLSHVESGAAISYFANFREAGEMAAVFADKILHAVPISELPVATAPMSLAINAVVIEKLGLRIPESMLNAASLVLHEK